MSTLVIGHKFTNHIFIFMFCLTDIVCGKHILENGVHNMHNVNYINYENHKMYMGMGNGYYYYITYRKQN